MPDSQAKTNRWPTSQKAGVQPYSVLGQIGDTPLLSLDRLSERVAPVRILGKAEWFNPGGSIKDRAALNMIQDGERSGLLTREKTILDATSGNTGIAYAMIGAALGYKVCLALPDSTGPRHKKILHSFGAELVLTDPQRGSDGAIEKAREIYADDPERYFYSDQYNNPANWMAHYNGTALEIMRQTRGQMTHFVCGLGTSGTFMGTGRRLQEMLPSVKLISFQPESPMHGLEGLKHMETAIVPGFYDPTLADEDLNIATEDALDMVKTLAREEGMLVGASSGAAIACAVRVAEKLESGTIVSIMPDSASKYMDLPYWEGITDVD